MGKASAVRPLCVVSASRSTRSGTRRADRAERISAHLRTRAFLTPLPPDLVSRRVRCGRRRAMCVVGRALLSRRLPGPRARVVWLADEAEQLRRVLHDRPVDQRSSALVGVRAQGTRSAGTSAGRRFASICAIAASTSSTVMSMSRTVRRRIEPHRVDRAESDLFVVGTRSRFVVLPGLFVLLVTEIGEAVGPD